MSKDDVNMTLRALRLLVAAIAVLALALPAAGMAARGTTIDQGVVQSVDSGQIVLRALDGNSFSLAVSATTKVRLNGARASIAEIQPGFVATVVHHGKAPALLVRAFGQVPLATDRGVVTALTRSAITLRTAEGTTVSVQLDGSTQVRFLGLPARRFLLRPGALVAVKHGANAPAKVVNVLKRAGA
jgi:hypothetical protein